MRVLSRLFRGKLLAGLRDAAEERCLHVADRAAFEETIAKLANIPWMVYSKPPFGGPEQVLQYLARYTHRIAITNQRLVRLDGDQVTFRWKDYAAGQALRELTLPAHEFRRRFLLHVLPDRFVRIRSYGLLANRGREAHLALCRKSLPPTPTPKPRPRPSARLGVRQGIDLREPATCGIIDITKQATESLRAWSQTLDVAIDPTLWSRQPAATKAMSLAATGPGEKETP